MGPMITFALLQAASSAVNGAINAYLNSPQKPAFREASGQETLYDEDNWARVLDVQEILCLIRPFIAGVQNLDISAFKVMPHAALRDPGQRLGTNKDNDDFNTSDAPPPYGDGIEDPETYLARQSYRIVRTTQRLVEVLTTASSGPSGSSPRAWNLNVTASIEIGLDLIEQYRSVTTRMSCARAGSFLSLVYSALNLCDAELLAAIEHTFSPVRLGNQDALPKTADKTCSKSNSEACYNLRLPSQRRYLAISTQPTAQPGPTTGSKVWDGIKWTSTILSLGAIGLIGMGAYQYCENKAKSKETSISPCIVSAGAGGENIVFTMVPEENGKTDAATAITADNKPANQHRLLHFGMLVKVTTPRRDKSSYLNGLSGSRGSSLAVFRVIHSDERYRGNSIGRKVTVRDRIILKEEETSKLLSRTQIKDDDWVVNFGLSDDVLWTIGTPM